MFLQENLDQDRELIKRDLFLMETEKMETEKMETEQPEIIKEEDEVHLQKKRIHGYNFF